MIVVTWPRQVFSRPIKWPGHVSETVCFSLKPIHLKIVAGKWMFYPIYTTTTQEAEAARNWCDTRNLIEGRTR